MSPASGLRAEDAMQRTASLQRRSLDVGGTPGGYSRDGGWDTDSGTPQAAAAGAAFIYS